MRGTIVIIQIFMPPRLKRYKAFIDTQFIDSLTWNKDYSLDDLKSNIKKKIASKQFRRIIFTGMGCSAIVSDVMKGFFIDRKIPIGVEVINDYDVDHLVDINALKDSGTLVIVSSYSGYSKEPIHAYKKIKKYTKNIIFLTSGGELGRIGKKENVSVILWRLRNPDREYPLFHVPQYFAILLDIFYTFGMFTSNYQKELAKTARYLKVIFNGQKLQSAQAFAKRLHNRDIILLATPKWYLTLLKLVNMHINEMAMAPAHRNYFHEFTHSEVAICSDPAMKQSIVLFRDSSEDTYTKGKMQNFIDLFHESAMQNKIEVLTVDIDQDNFFRKFFSTLLFVHYMTYFLGLHYKIQSRELISKSAGNPWYNQMTIQKEGSKRLHLTS